MATYLERAGGYVNWEEEQEISEEHMENMGQIAISNLYSGFLARLFLDVDSGLPMNGFYGNDCKISKIDSATIEVSTGFGLYYDTSDTDAFYSVYKPIVVATAFQETIDPADTNKHRYDIVCLAPDTEDDESQTETFYDPLTSTTSPASTDTRRKFSYAVQVVTGTEVNNIATPSVPSTPAGYIICGRAHVDDTGVLTVSDALRDQLTMTDSMRYNKIESEDSLEITAVNDITVSSQTIEFTGTVEGTLAITNNPTIPGYDFSENQGVMKYSFGPCNHTWTPLWSEYDPGILVYNPLGPSVYLSHTAGSSDAAAFIAPLSGQFKLNDVGNFTIKSISIKYLRNGSGTSLQFNINKRSRTDMTDITSVLSYDESTEFTDDTNSLDSYTNNPDLLIDDLEDYEFFMTVSINGDGGTLAVQLHEVTMNILHEDDASLLTIS